MSEFPILTTDQAALYLFNELHQQDRYVNVGKVFFL